MGLVETTTTVTKRAELQEVGASTDEGTKGWRDHHSDPSDVMQVELSVKHAYGIPVARDSRSSDIRQRGMRACLFYDAGSGVDRNTGETTSEYREHFLCNTYKTLAIQHPQKEEQWLFPDSAEGERKFLVRTDFGSDGGRHGWQKGGGSRKHSQWKGDGSPATDGRDKLFLFVELTCTVQTVKDRDTVGDSVGDAYTRDGESRKGSKGTRGPFKSFRRTASPRARSGKGKRKTKRGVDSESSYEGSSDDDDGYADGSRIQSVTLYSSFSYGSPDAWKQGIKGESDTAQSDCDEGSTDTATDSNDLSNEDKALSKRQTSGSGISRRRCRGRKVVERGRERGLREKQKNGGKSKSIPPLRNLRGRSSASSRMFRGRRGTHSEGPTRGSRRGRKGNGPVSSGGSTDETNQRYGERSVNSGGGGSFSSRNGSGRGSGGRRGWRGIWSSRKGTSRWRSNNSQSHKAGMVEVEMSCGWVLIPFLELASAQEVKRVRYSLSGGTPFAKTEINEDEVMTRRYGWRALLKALKIEGTNKGSEVEIKILPVKTLSKAKQEDIFRLPRNVVLSDTFVSLVRYYREYTANVLARRGARGIGNVGFGAGLGSSEPVLALFPRMAADSALMVALKKQWDIEVRKSHVNGRLGATVSTGLASIGVGTGGGGGLTEVTGGARGVTLTKAFENAVMKLWPAYCHIDTQRRRVGEGIGAESYEEREARSHRIREILDSSESFRSDTPTSVLRRGGEDGSSGGKTAGGVNASLYPTHESGVMVAFTLKEVRSLERVRELGFYESKGSEPD